MNATHVHLLITHLPIFGSFLGAFVLGYGLYANSDSTKIAAYYLVIISALGAGIAYLTGESAEETVEHVQGVARQRIEPHEDFAKFALISLIILAILAIAGIYAIFKKLSFAKNLSKFIFILSLISFGLAAWTGYLGGMIRHTEVYNNTAEQPLQLNDEADE